MEINRSQICCFRSFVRRSFVPSFLRSFVLSFLRSFVLSFLRSFVPSFVCALSSWGFLGHKRNGRSSGCVQSLAWGWRAGPWDALDDGWTSTDVDVNAENSSNMKVEVAGRASRAGRCWNEASTADHGVGEREGSKASTTLTHSDPPRRQVWSPR